MGEPRDVAAGPPGEDLACRLPAAEGLAILERNYRCRAGEIDIVARDGGVVVFVEVKERRSESHGTAVEAVTWRKRRRIVRAARLYAAAHAVWRTHRSASTWWRSTGGLRDPA